MLISVKNKCDLNNLIQQFTTITDPDQLHKLVDGNYGDLPFHLYWKEINNKYWGANDRLAQDVGLAKATDVLHYSDLEFWPNQVDYLKENDAKVVKDAKSCIFFESADMGDGAKIYAVSYKSPWYSGAGKLIGIQGISFVSIEERITDDANKLTNRQLDCLYYLVKGYPIKIIANTLSLSPRTVEHYVETIKSKLGVSTRVELIIKALNMGVIKERLQSD